ncbi:MAG: gliding motility-associated C-terminal domain-containing protein [Saprospiraceae bacterium]
MRSIFPILLFLRSTIFFAQENLVPNGDFGEVFNCNGVASIAHWFVPQNNKIDLSNLCPYVDWWRFIRDQKQGINNSQCGYIETYYKGFADDIIYSGRLYLAIKLLQKLEANKPYYFEMMVRSVDTFPNYKLVNTVFTDAQDVAFTNEIPIFDFDIPRNFFSVKPIIVSQLTPDYQWHKVSSCFIASGNEQYMIIGNFRNDASTNILVNGKTNPNFPNGLIANYAIDDVVLVKMEIALNDTSRCVSDTLILDATKSLPENLKYEWNDGSTNSTYTVFTDQKVELTIKYSASCLANKRFQVRSFGNNNGRDIDLPVMDTSICPDQTLLLKSGIHLVNEQVRWDNGSESPEIAISSPGSYKAQISTTCGTTVNQSYRVVKKDCSDGIFLPNIITPNGDQINDVFRPFFKPDFPGIAYFDLSIYSRWGEKIYSSTNEDFGWDGTLSGKSLNSGVYVYALRIIDRAGKKYNKQGTVNIIH